jgi:hypothetical protein
LTSGIKGADIGTPATIDDDGGTGGRGDRWLLSIAGNLHYDILATEGVDCTVYLWTKIADGGEFSV